MARDFTAVTNFIGWGSDASIDDVRPVTVACWMQQDAKTTFGMMFAKRGFANGWSFGVTNGAGGTLDLEYNWSTNRGVWGGTNGLTAGNRFHVGFTYDPTAGTSADPVFYVNGAVDTTVDQSAPAGTVNSDAAEPANTGKDDSFDFDYMDGRIGWLVYTDGVLDAAAINRAMWWGRPHGGMKLYHPLVTDKLNNEGSATANGTVNGTVNVASFVPPVQRPGSAMMGMGIGW